MMTPIRTSNSKEIGKAAEDFACRYLLKQNLKLLTKNYSCRVGEIDLIMQENDAIIFIEVRYRNNTQYGQSAETVVATKQVKIIKTAAYYLKQHKYYDRIPCRFDVIALRRDHDLVKIQWIKNAFQTNG